MTQVKPIPRDMQLGSSLAQRLFQLREFRGYTVKQLAQMSRFSIQRIEDLEAGLETWLSATDRQLLAKSLNVEPMILQEVEVRPKPGPSTPATMMFDRENTVKLADAILKGARDLQCPDCGHTLKCSVQDGLDIDGLPVRFAKAFCPQCPFTLKTV